MSIEYVELADYLAIAVEVTGLTVETIARVTKLDLADSALHAPAAAFADTEFYPDFIDKAAVLAVRLVKNHIASRRPAGDGAKTALPGSQDDHPHVQRPHTPEGSSAPAPTP